MQKKFRIVAVAGTFDELHKGHRALLEKAFEAGERVTVGISSDEFVKQLGKPHKTGSYARRLKALKNFLGTCGFLQRAEIIPINDIFGGVLLSRVPIEALIVSKETESTALRINEKRKELGLAPLRIIVIGMIPSQNGFPVSTTRIRLGEIDREGYPLEK